MPRSLLLAACLVPLGHSCPAKADGPAEPVDASLRAIQGDWASPRARAKGEVSHKFTFKGNEVSWSEFRFGGDTDISTTSFGSYTVRLDGKASPKVMTLTPVDATGGVPEIAIFEVDGNTLRLCLGTGGKAPKGFDDKAGRLVVLKRRTSHLETARAVLGRAAEWELYSLDPIPLRGDNKAGRIAYLVLEWYFGWPRFHDLLVVGKMTVTDANTRKALLAALNKGVGDEEEKEKKRRAEGLLTATGCFQPRHGVRATHDDKTVELLICFECKPIYIFVAGEHQVFHTTSSPQETFDGVLKAA